MAGKKEIKLVPTEEQPYEIPENWCWVRMRDLYVINPKNSASDDLPASFVPMERIAPGMVGDFTYEVQPWGKAKKGHTQFADGDVAFAKISPCFENRKSMMVNGLENGIGAGTTELIILRQPLVDQAYTFWMVTDDRFILGGNQTYSGTVGQQRISMDYVREYPVPLAPLAEQKRIVDTIVDLFADLDKAAENAERIIDNAENRKKAILHQAFVGELTAQWRADNGLDEDSWKSTPSAELFEYVTSGSRGWAQYYSDNGAVFLRMGNLDHGTIELDMGDIQYVNLPEKAEGQRSRVQKGDILISITADVGMVGLVRDIDYEGYINQHIALARPAYKESAEFLAWYLVSDVGFNQFRQKQRGATKVGLGLADIKSLNLKIPTLAEQQEIVRILDELLGNEQRIKEAAEEMLDKIAMMKKSILADAFRGKLGTNDPADEPATELLRQILA